MVKLSEIDSTNNYLKKLLSNSKPLAEGTVIMADHQFAGRGQQQNSWEAEKGKNLTFSIFLKPNFINLNQQFYLSKAISLGINDCLRAIIGDDCKIKWPNDIYYKNQKLGGVLIENLASGSALKSSVVGIGINVNQQIFGKGVERATSLSKILHQEYNLNDLLTQLCKSIECRYLQIRAKQFVRLDEDYLKRLYRMNEKHQFLIGEEILEGTVKGVSAEGFLLLQIDDVIKGFDLKQLKFIFNSD